MPNLICNTFVTFQGRIKLTHNSLYLQNHVHSTIIKSTTLSPSHSTSKAEKDEGNENVRRKKGGTPPNTPQKWKARKFYKEGSWDSIPFVR